MLYYTGIIKTIVYQPIYFPKMIYLFAINMIDVLKRKEILKKISNFGKFT